MSGNYSAPMRKLIAVFVITAALTALPAPASAHEPDDSDCSNETHAVLGDRADWAAVELVAWVLNTDCLLDSGDRKRNSLPSATTALYDDQKVIVVGGPAAVPETKLKGLDVEQRLWGADRLETMRAVVEWADEQQDPSPETARDWVEEGTHGDWTLTTSRDGYPIAYTDEPNARWPTLHTDSFVVRCGFGDELEAYVVFDSLFGDSHTVRMHFNPSGDSTSGEWGLAVSNDALFAPDGEATARLIRANHDALTFTIFAAAYFSSGDRFESADRGNTFSMKGAAKAVRGVMERCE